MTTEPAADETRRLRAVVARLAQMADHWEQKLPETIRTPAVVSAIRAVLEPVSSAVSVVPPATEQTALREQVAAVLRPHASLGGTPPRYELPFFDGATPSLPRISGWKPLDKVADAVLAVLPATGRAAALAENLRYVLGHNEPRHAHEQPGVWDTSGEPCGHCARLAVARQNLAAYDGDPNAVLPAPVDRAAVLREAADLVAADTGFHIRYGSATDYAERYAAMLRQKADESAVVPPPALTEEGRLRAQVEVLQQDAERDQGLAKVGARCMREGHQGLIERGRLVLEGWRFALSTALDLGTGAPWEAIHERVKELAAAEAPHAETPDEAPLLCDHCKRPGHSFEDCPRANAPAVVAQPGKEHDTGARIVAHVLATHTDLHCLNCAPPPHGDVWTPVTADELDDGGVCVGCGVDVLIPQDGAQPR